MCMYSMLHAHTELPGPDKQTSPSAGIWSWVAEYEGRADLSAGALPGSLLRAHSLDLHPL